MTTTRPRGRAATEKVAVSVPARLLKRAHAEVRAGRARSLSAYVAQAIAEKQQRQDLLAVLAEMDARHGPPSADDEAWAQCVLGV